MSSNRGEAILGTTLSEQAGSSFVGDCSGRKREKIHQFFPTAGYELHASLTQYPEYPISERDRAGRFMKVGRMVRTDVENKTKSLGAAACL